MRIHHLGQSKRQPNVMAMLPVVIEIVQSTPVDQLTLPSLDARVALELWIAAQNCSLGSTTTRTFLYLNRHPYG